MEATELQSLAVVEIFDIGKTPELMRLTVPSVCDEVKVDFIIKKICEMKGIDRKQQRYFGLLLGDEKPLKKFKFSDELLLPVKGVYFKKWCFCLKTEKRLIKTNPVIAQLFFHQAQHDISIGRLKPTPDQLASLEDCLDPEFLAVEQYLSICHTIPGYDSLTVNSCQLVDNTAKTIVNLPQTSYSVDISQYGLKLISEDTKTEFSVQWFQVFSFRLDLRDNTLTYCLELIHHKPQTYLPLKSEQCEYMLAVTLEMINDIQADDPNAPSFYITNISNLPDGSTEWENILFNYRGKRLALLILNYIIAEMVNLLLVYVYLELILKRNTFGVRPLKGQRFTETMNETQLMQRHALFQKSWVQKTCSHGNRDSPDGQKPLDLSQVTSRIDSGLRRRDHGVGDALKSTRILPPLQRCRVSPSPVAPPRSLHRNHGNKKLNSVNRPWREKVPKLSDNTDKHIEIHYSKIAPKDKWMEYKPKRYVANPKYGSIYEIRKDKTSKPDPIPPPATWLWENEYKLWRLDKLKTPLPTRCLKRKEITERKERKNSDERPHAELFAAYNAELLLKQRRHVCAIEIQRQVRGWLIRKAIKELRHQVLRGLSMTWWGFIQDYRETIIRIKSRYGVMDNSCRFNLKEVSEYVHFREKCEQVFHKMSRWEKMEKLDLPEFFRRCDLYPTEGDITRAFNTIFRGSLNTAEVVFVLDCSASFGPVNFQHQVNFVKDVVQGFEVAPDRVRVGVVPYNESVFHCFGLTKFKNLEEVKNAMDSLQFKNGLTRTDLALKMMRQLFKSSRPGVQKIAVILTDGKSPDPDGTRREARLARDENIDIFAIGVGHTVDKEQLEYIGGSPDHVKICTDYSCLSQFRNLVHDRMCMVCCAFCHQMLPRIQKEGLYKSEVMDIVFTLYPPQATDIDPSIHHLRPAPLLFSGSDQADGKSRQITPGILDVCRPLNKREVIDILLTVYPPEATDLDARPSRWIRPIVDGTEAWSLFDDEILQRTDYKQCLRLVIQAKLDRDGVMDIPTDLKWGVEQVSNIEEALEKVEAYLQLKKQQRIEGEDLDKGRVSDEKLLEQKEEFDKDADDNAGSRNTKANMGDSELGIKETGCEFSNPKRNSSDEGSNHSISNFDQNDQRTVNIEKTKDENIENIRNITSRTQSPDQSPSDQNPRPGQTNILRINHEEDPNLVQSSLQVLTLNHKDNTEILNVREHGTTRRTLTLNSDHKYSKEFRRGWVGNKNAKDIPSPPIGDEANPSEEYSEDDKYQTWVGPNPFINREAGDIENPESERRREMFEDTSYFT
ncbi:hypothetical protein LOTGIDRAFT_155995 [Lottia gigantea]|uniref:VWFA domain-containing protein n=1 Tax=Lottia gigantea TaxID=225164 RepID=V4B378_LOTGI|nr:hypothetical protein LOTGIDRAFT_155995 [Lottia gigantea]ESP04773.1 hypothetical protein LOTGIDRAFT_155995 [Lottia gigantea]